MAEQMCNVGRGIELCWEGIGDPDRPTMLLIMGLATQMIAWQDDFCERLADRGFYVIRFDNRDIGRSTHIDAPTPTLPQLALRLKSGAAYTLATMAGDTAGLLRRLDRAPAHVVGASMGGMIAQTLAALHPEYVTSLVSIMSNTGSRWSGQASPRLLPALLSRQPTGRDAYIARIEETFGRIGSSELPRDPEDLRRLAALSYDRDHNPAGPQRQLAAILASGDRSAELKAVDVPTLVIHGDADPLVALSGGRATARAIRGARLMIVPRMGHDLPRVIWPQIIDAIVDNARLAESRSAVPAAG
jgi:pimeloyl-ACP methyl ester carboxylesterase